MAHVIAVAGKGGVGKTTLCGLIIQYLCESGKSPVLAVDADANSNLNEVLGVKAGPTLGQVREEIERAGVDKDSPIPNGMTKADYLQMRLEDALTEEDDYDLMIMGRSQGQGCYCYVNGLLQAQIQKLQGNYPYILVDNEAGMEHISRGILPQMDTMIVVSDCSRRGVEAAGRIAALVHECHMKPKTMGLIINRAPNGELNQGIQDAIKEQGLTLLGIVPHDEAVYNFDCDGKAIVNLPKDSLVKKALTDIIEKLDL
ncbi:AAA family ATPase [Blautia liquoris]|jgi:CO dehydrogenase maturation factor|uniref:AAA family ATPase n=1 Tax=Blautia liquoris TaxID=2779518 RepID=A0A7M2RF78_9FIRM|nr:AAA family ATPase [Blautia liquoris]QOV19003.1 AAA family ATPase [Blautia liquoris]